MKNACKLLLFDFRDNKKASSEQNINVFTCYGNREPDQTTGQPATQCTRNLIITVNGQTVQLMSGGLVIHNDKEMRLPHVLDSFSVEKVTSEFQKVYTKF